MNRHERRAKKAVTQRQAVDRVIAVHEAGHAVARVLVADSLGWGPDEVLEHIDIHAAPLAMGVSAELRELQAEGATCGSFLSRPMYEFLQAKISPEAFDAARNGDEMRALFTEMRAAGIDVDVWFRAKIIEVVFGPMAEAKLTGRSFDAVWSGDGSEGDNGDLLNAGFICGIAEKRFWEAAGEIIDIAKQYIARPEVWGAILALADKMKPGRMNGRVAAAIITRALAQSAIKV
jgi:hypothetical protein